MKHTWNYRVIEFADSAADGPWRAIHEVHYENGKPVLYSESPAGITWDVSEGDSAAGDQIDRLRQALTLPVLVERDFHAGLGSVKTV